MKANQLPVSLALQVIYQLRGLSDELEKLQQLSTRSWTLIPSQLTTMAQIMADGHTATNAVQAVLYGSAALVGRGEMACW